MTTTDKHEAVVARSVYEEADREAQRHKWIESQKQGRDLGESAIEEWYRLYWLDYCRRKRLEHLQGNQCWREFGEEGFGHLRELQPERDPLLQQVCDRVCEGGENLEIINWALQESLPINRVIDVLAELDVNRGRLEPARR